MVSRRDAAFHEGEKVEESAARLTGCGLLSEWRGVIYDSRSSFFRLFSHTHPYLRVFLHHLHLQVALLRVTRVWCERHM